MHLDRSKRLWLKTSVWYFSVAAATIYLCHHGREIAAVWPADAVILTVLLRLRAARDKVVLSASFCAGAAAYLAFGAPVAEAMTDAAQSALEVWIAAVTLRRLIRPDDLIVSTTGVMGFVVVAGFAAPLTSAILAEIIKSALYEQSFWRSTLLAWTSHALGLLLYSPLFLAVAQGQVRDTLRSMSVAAKLEVSVLLVSTGIFTVIVFHFDRLALPFVLFAPTMLVTFRVGQLGTKAAVGIIGLIGAFLTAHNHGPIAGITVNVLERALLFQGFLATLLLTCLPAAADLAARSTRAAQLSHLAASRARYIDAITKCSPDAIVSYNRDGYIQSWNPSAERLFGYAEKQVVGRRVPSFFPTRVGDNPDPVNQVDLDIHQVISSARTERYHRNGHPVAVAVSSAPLIDANGEYIGVSAVYQDLSRQEQVESELANSQFYLRKLFATVDMGCFMARNLDGIINHWSAGCERLYGWKAAEALGKKSHELLQTSFPSTRAFVDSTLRNTGQWTGELSHQTKDGAVITVLTRLIRRTDADEESVLEMGLDVTELRQAQAALVKSEAELRATFDQAAVGIAHISLDGTWMKVNDRLCSIVSRRPHELVGTSLAAITHLDDQESAQQPRRELLDGKRPSCTFTQRFVQPDGLVVPVYLSLSLIRDGVGQPLYFLSVAQDIRERVAAEEALRDGQARLAQAAKMEALGRLAGGIAHDFNNVLQTIGNSIDVAQLQVAPAQANVMRFLDIAAQAVDRGAAVTGRLLSFSRRSELSTERLDASSILDELEKVLTPGLGARVSLRLDVPTDLPAILADRNQLETVIINLCNNARDALTGEGSVVLTARTRQVPGDQSTPSDLQPGQYVELTVKDDGCGMTRETLARVSEPFFTTKVGGKGTGLGLAMARGFLEQSGGTLSIISAVGKGTTVSMWLPAAGDCSQPQACVQTATPETCTTADARVLLVDDQADVRASMAASLAGRNLHVVEAEDAQQALQLLADGCAPDILISDLTMPGALDGLDLVASARRLLPGLPAMIVTGHATEGVRPKIDEAEQTGPFVFVRKPTSTRALIGLMRPLMSQSKPKERAHEEGQGSLSLSFV